MPNKKNLGFSVLFIHLLFLSELNASLYDYIYPSREPSYSNYGTLGLINMPSARFHKAGTISFSWSHYDPYIRGDIIAYPFDWFEASYFYTDVNNALYSDVASFSGGQTYKDKGFDFKFRLIKENAVLPQVSAGFRDGAGTGTFSSEFLVFSKKISNFDFTLGLGWGALSGGKTISNPLAKIDDRFKSRTDTEGTLGGEFSLGKYFSGSETSVFGGVEIFLPNLKGTRLKIEYDGTDYLKEGFPLGRESFKYAFEPVLQPESRFNFGMTFPLFKGFQMKIGYLKGNTVNFGFSFSGNLAQKDNFIRKNDPPKATSNANIIKAINSRESNVFLYRTSLISLNKNAIYLQKASVENDTLRVLFSQSKYSSYMMANGRAARVLDEITPDKIKFFELTNVNGNLPLYKITIPRTAFKTHEESEAFNIVKNNTVIESVSSKDLIYEYNPKAELPKIFWRISPAIRSQIGGPDGFYFGDIRIRLTSEIKLLKNLALVTNLSSGLYDNFDELKLPSDSVLPHVRTEIVQYLKNSSDFALNRLQLNYFGSFNKDIYYKFSYGVLEEMFGGYGGEILWRPFNKNFGLGLEAWNVKQRDFDMKLDYLDYQTKTGFLNFHYYEPNTRILFTVKGGRFLARDSGFNFDFSRRFKSGLRLGAFFSLTDISRQEFGEGSFDKGFYFHIPLESFFENYQKGSTGWGLRPLTRDGAAILNHSHSLWGVTDQGNYNNIVEDWDELYK